MANSRRLILNFHGIGKPVRPFDSGEESVWITESLFSAFADATATQPLCEITFDDGNKSDVEIALPVLRSRGLRATFFVLTGRVGSPGFLDENDIRLLISEGMQIGLHGRDHVSWRTADRELLVREIDQAKSQLEAIVGQRITTAACPFGEYGRNTLAHLRRSGFATIYTSDGGVADTTNWLCPRRSIRSGDSPEIIPQTLSESMGDRMLRSAKTFIKRLR